LNASPSHWGAIFLPFHQLFLCNIKCNHILTLKNSNLLSTPNFSNGTRSKFWSFIQQFMSSSTCNTIDTLIMFFSWIGWDTLLGITLSHCLKQIHQYCMILMHYLHNWMHIWWSQSRRVVDTKKKTYIKDFVLHRFMLQNFSD